MCTPHVSLWPSDESQQYLAWNMNYHWHQEEFLSLSTMPHELSMTPRRIFVPGHNATWIFIDTKKNYCPIAQSPILGVCIILTLYKTGARHWINIWTFNRKNHSVVISTIATSLIKKSCCTRKSWDKTLNCLSSQIHVSWKTYIVLSWIYHLKLVEM